MDEMEFAKRLKEKLNEIGMSLSDLSQSLYDEIETQIYEEYEESQR